MLTMSVTFAVVIVMAASGIIAARAPESLVSIPRADGEPKVPTPVQYLILGERDCPMTRHTCP